MKSYFPILVIAALLLLNLSGCMSFTTLQSAKTLEPGDVIIGAGAAMPVEKNKVTFMPEINSRVGIVSSFDIGAKVSAGAVYFLDAKYQIIQDPITISADLGWSYFSISDGIGDIEGKATCWYPMIMIGQDNWYIAVKKVHMMTSGKVKLIGDLEFEGGGWFSTNVTVGGILGEKIRLLPEVNVIIPDNGGKSLFVPAVGLQFVL